jgi:hypothetical protein
MRTSVATSSNKHERTEPCPDVRPLVAIAVNLSTAWGQPGVDQRRHQSVGRDGRNPYKATSKPHDAGSYASCVISQPHELDELWLSVHVSRYPRMRHDGRSSAITCVTT